jgi:hypothetical protein
MTARSLYYILDAAGQPQAVDALTWAAWFDGEGQERGFLRHTVWAEPDVCVVIRFIGLDPVARLFKRRPRVWEVYLTDHGQVVDVGRCETRDAAEDLHARLVTHLEKRLGAAAVEGADHEGERRVDAEAPAPERWLEGFER